jgi:hypothetical protein
LTGLIGNGAIVRLAIAQQFHRRTRRRPAGDDGIARWFDAGDVECRDTVVAFRWQR